MSEMIFVVFGLPLTRPGDREFLGAYSTAALAQRFFDAQDAAVRENLAVVEIALNEHPSDEFWIKPKGLATAHALEGLPADAIPRDRSTLESTLVSIAGDAGGLADADAERFDRHAAARDELNRRIDHLARLAAGTEYALVCGACGQAISQLAAYVEESPLSHTYRPGTCEVCGRTGSVNPSGDWIGEGD
ncbi:MAG: hypothetical protein WCF04_13330 [Candidatus Nanopelagicales bacterium]